MQEQDNDSIGRNYTSCSTSPQKKGDTMPSNLTPSFIRRRQHTFNTIAVIDGNAYGQVERFTKAMNEWNLSLSSDISDFKDNLNISIFADYKNKRMPVIPEETAKELLMEHLEESGYHRVVPTPQKEVKTFDFMGSTILRMLEQKIRQMKKSNRDIVDINDFLNSGVPVADASMITCLESTDEDSDCEEKNKEGETFKFDMDALDKLEEDLKSKNKEVTSDKVTENSISPEVLEYSSDGESSCEFLGHCAPIPKPSENPISKSSEIPIFKPFENLVSKPSEIPTRVSTSRMFWDAIYDRHKTSNRYKKEADGEGDQTNDDKKILSGNARRSGTGDNSSDSFPEGPYLNLSDPRLKPFLKPRNKYICATKSSPNTTTTNNSTVATTRSCLKTSSGSSLRSLYLKN